jgi:hypothetical protein
MRCAVDQRGCEPDGRACRRFPGERASCGCAYRIEDRLICHLDGQPCAGDECAEWPTAECQERRLGHAASVRVIEESEEQARMRTGHT